MGTIASLLVMGITSNVVLAIYQFSLKKYKITLLGALISIFLLIILITQSF